MFWVKCSSIVPCQQTKNSKQRRGLQLTARPGVAKGFRQHGVEQLRLDGEGEGFRGWLSRDRQLNGDVNPQKAKKSQGFGSWKYITRYLHVCEGFWMSRKCWEFGNRGKSETSITWEPVGCGVKRGEGWKTLRLRFDSCFMFGWWRKTSRRCLIICFKIQQIIMENFYTQRFASDDDLQRIDNINSSPNLWLMGGWSWTVEWMLKWIARGKRMDGW